MTHVTNVIHSNVLSAGQIIKLGCISTGACGDSIAQSISGENRVLTGYILNDEDVLTLKWNGTDRLELGFATN